MLVSDPHFETSGRCRHFDFVVVGAGSAGCALAAALTDDASCSVLLVEAGHYYGRMDQHPVVLQRIDKFAFSLGPGQSFPAKPRFASFAWQFEGELNEHLKAIIVRGKVVGGSSAINGASFTRARPRDHDIWAEAGNDEWAFEKVLPSLRAIETDLNFGDTPLHGARGPVRVQRSSRDNLGLPSRLFVEAALAAGFPWDEDMNGLSAGGVGLMPLNAVDAIRQNAGASFIDRVIARPNLSLLDRAHVRRVIVEGDRASGLEIIYRGVGHRVMAGEVILCAGGINSPHLLMLSGIGPEAKLRAVGIDPVHVLDPVGANLADHPYVIWPFSLSERALAADNKPGGSLALNYASRGDDAEDLRVIPYSSPSVALGGTGPAGLGFHCSLGTPESRGEILLRSRSPRQVPAVRYNYLKEEADKRRLRECVELVHGFLQTSGYRGARAAVAGDLATIADNPAKLDHWIATNLLTAYHSAGTCKMGPNSDEAAVVDQYCRVKGIRNLRVADTSIIPFLMTRGTHATAIMIGEHAAGLIKRTTTG
jgi:choline dehydrogenase